MKDRLPPAGCERLVAPPLNHLQEFLISLSPLGVSQDLFWVAMFCNLQDISENWALVHPVVADPIAQDDDKRNNIQIHTDIFPSKVHRGRGQDFPIFISCRYLVELGPRQLGLPVAGKRGG